MEYNVRKLPQGYVVQDSANGFEDLAAFTTLEDALSWLQERFAEDQPIDDGWIEWNGEDGEKPEGIAATTRVEIKMRNGETGQATFHEFSWRHRGNRNHDIVAYRVLP